MLRGGAEDRQNWRGSLQREDDDLYWRVDRAGTFTGSSNIRRHARGRDRIGA
jgi:hypothetical protein